MTASNDATVAGLLERARGGDTQARDRLFALCRNYVGIVARAHVEHWLQAKVDASDLMRRMVKEELVKFDGTPLFPERIASTVTYRLSDPEAKLYAGVTDYVREEMNRAMASICAAESMAA